MTGRGPRKDRRAAATAGRWIAVRLVSGLLVLFGAATVAFLAVHLVPNDPVASVLGGQPATPAIVSQIRADLSVGGPLPSEYLHFLSRLARGDLGYSFQLNEPVSQAIGDELGPTAALAGTAMLLGVAGGLLIAMATAGPGRRLRRATSSALELAVISTPTFWSGIVLLTLFSFRLHWFPVVSAAGGWRSLVLPAVTLALPVAAVLSQLLRIELGRALAQPFVITARAHGLRERHIRWGHALRHAALPAVTLSAWIVGSLLSGAVLVETVFGRPGLGTLTEQAISNADLPVVVGVVLLSAAAFVVLNTAVDLVYLIIDPRLRST